MLKVDGVSYRYRDAAAPALQDVSLNIPAGGVYGLLGPNGAGKTTCFYMIVGLVPADGGDVFINDARLTHQPMHQRAQQGLSYLPQEASVFRKLNVEENIRAVLELLELPENELNSLSSSSNGGLTHGCNCTPTSARPAFTASPSTSTAWGHVAMG